MHIALRKRDMGNARLSLCFPRMYLPLLWELWERRKARVTLEILLPLLLTLYAGYSVRRSKDTHFPASQTRRRRRTHAALPLAAR